METNTKYNRREMEENLPDYIFGRLNSESKEIFERTLPNFPDLIEEIKQVRNVFNKLEQIDFDKISYLQTKDLPDKVAIRLRTNTHSQTYKNYNNRFEQKYIRSWKYLLPAMAILVFIALILPNIYLNNKNKAIFLNSNIKQQEQSATIGNTSDNTSPIVKITSNDIAKNNLTPKEILNLQSSIYNISNDRIIQDNEIPYINSYLEEIYNNFFDKLPIKDLDNTIVQGTGIDKSINSYLDNLDESDVESILNEVENVNFKS
jgi:hypothetical protein